MNKNIYWTIYKNIEKELLDLSNSIHIDDQQLEVYSIKITELLIRTVVEVESISKELYLINGGAAKEPNDLFFDTDCLNFLESKWLLSKKQIQIAASNFYFDSADNSVLTPLKNANKRGSSSSGWLRAYQAVKHNRAKSLDKGNLKNLIRALAGLYILNLYFIDNSYKLEKDGSGTNFDRTAGSSVFAVKLHVNPEISVDAAYVKNPDFDECVYLLQPTEETRKEVQQALAMLNERTNERIQAEVTRELERRLSETGFIDQDDLNQKINTIIQEVKNRNIMTVGQENAQSIKKAFDNIRYQAILNKQQY